MGKKTALIIDQIRQQTDNFVNFDLDMAMFPEGPLKPKKKTAAEMRQEIKELNLALFESPKFRIPKRQIYANDS